MYVVNTIGKVNTNIRSNAIMFTANLSEIPSIKATRQIANIMAVASNTFNITNNNFNTFENKSIKC